jgi:hypothetical protein
MEAVDHHTGMRQHFTNRVDKAVIHVGACPRDVGSESLGNRGQEALHGLLTAVRQHREHGQRPARGLSAHDGDEVPMAFFKRDLIQSQHTERLQRCPIDALVPPSVENPFDGLCAHALLAADIAHRAVDKAAQGRLLEGPRMGAVRLVPATALGGGGMVAAIGTAVTLRANLNVDRALQDRQMAQP